MHPGKTLQKIDDLDDIKVIRIDRRTLPKGIYTEDGFETRQVFDLDISRVVTEYQAQRLINETGSGLPLRFQMLPPRRCNMAMVSKPMRFICRNLSYYLIRGGRLAPPPSTYCVVPN